MNSDRRELKRSHQRIYDGIVDWYVKAFFTDDEDSSWLDDFSARLPSGSLVADLGAGPGNFASYLSQHGHRVISTDISTNMVRASRRLLADVPAVVADFTRPPIRDQALDGALCAYSLMHIPAEDTGETLHQIVQTLRPGGLLGLMLKEGNGSYKFQSPDVAGAEGIVQLWTIQEIGSILTNLGLRIEYTDSKPTLSQYEFNHLKILVLARRPHR